jgi:hypothetical protein
LERIEEMPESSEPGAKYQSLGIKASGRLAKLKEACGEFLPERTSKNKSVKDLGFS